MLYKTVTVIVVFVTVNLLDTLKLLRFFVTPKNCSIIRVYNIKKFLIRNLAKRIFSPTFKN